MGDVTPLLDSTGATRQVSVDRLNTRDGAAAAASEEVQLVKLGWGSEDDLKLARPAQGLPVVEDKFQSVLQRSAALSSSGSSQTGLAANGSRRKVYASNSGASGIWVDFGQTAPKVPLRKP